MLYGPEVSVDGIVVIEASVVFPDGDARVVAGGFMIVSVEGVVIKAVPVEVDGLVLRCNGELDESFRPHGPVVHPGVGAVFQSIGIECRFASMVNQILVRLLDVQQVIGHEGVDGIVRRGGVTVLGLGISLSAFFVDDLHDILPVGDVPVFCFLGQGNSPVPVEDTVGFGKGGIAVQPVFLGRYQARGFDRNIGEVLVFDHGVTPCGDFQQMVEYPEVVRFSNQSGQGSLGSCKHPVDDMDIPVVAGYVTMQDSCLSVEPYVGVVTEVTQSYDDEMSVDGSFLEGSVIEVFQHESLFIAEVHDAEPCYTSGHILRKGIEGIVVFPIEGVEVEGDGIIVRSEYGVVAPGLQERSDRALGLVGDACSVQNLAEEGEPRGLPEILHDVGICKGIDIPLVNAVGTGAEATSQDDAYEEHMQESHGRKRFMDLLLGSCRIRGVYLGLSRNSRKTEQDGPSGRYSPIQSHPDRCSIHPL